MVFRFRVAVTPWPFVVLAAFRAAFVVDSVGGTAAEDSDESRHREVPFVSFLTRWDRRNQPDESREEIRVKIEREIQQRLGEELGLSPHNASSPPDTAKAGTRGSATVAASYAAPHANATIGTLSHDMPNVAAVSENAELDLDNIVAKLHSTVAQQKLHGGLFSPPFQQNSSVNSSAAKADDRNSSAASNISAHVNHIDDTARPAEIEQYLTARREADEEEEVEGRVGTVTHSLENAVHEFVSNTPGETTAAFADPAGMGKCKLLVFWAVGYSARTVSLVVRNTNFLRRMMRRSCVVDIYLAHYDQRRDDWNLFNREWYMENVQFSADRRGYKFQLMKKLLGEPTVLEPEVQLSSYDWVWALDEDIDFTHTNVLEMLRLADESDALIALPTFTQDGSPVLDYPIQAPDRNCLFRYVPIVEVIFPLIRPNALRLLLTSCKDCIGKETTWGLDRVWCHYSARMLDHDPHTACAVIDNTPVIHRNFRTMKEKYGGVEAGGQLRAPGRGNIDDRFYDKASQDMRKVEEFHKVDFVEGSTRTIKAYSCMGRDKQLRSINSMDRMHWIMRDIQGMGKPVKREKRLKALFKRHARQEQED